MVQYIPPAWVQELAAWFVYIALSAQVVVFSILLDQHGKKGK